MTRCKNCLQELRVDAAACGNCGALVHPSPVVYFHTPLGYFIPLCLLTFGFYEIYWHYKNWTAVKKAQDIKGIYPFWRAVFPIFFCWSLLSKIHHDAGKYGYKHPRAFCIAVFIFMGSYFFLSIILSILGKLVNDAGVFLSLLASPLSMVALLITQRAIKFHNTHAISGYSKKQKLTKGEMVFIVLGCIGWFIVLGCIGYIRWMYGILS